jgi:hypothetical protein
MKTVKTTRERDVHIDRRARKPDLAKPPKAAPAPPMSARLQKALPGAPGSAMPIRLEQLYPQAHAEIRRFDSFRPARIHKPPLRSRLAAGRLPSTLLSSYLPREKGTGDLLYPQAFKKVLQILNRLTGGLELLPVEHGILSLLFSGYPGPSDIQTTELLTGLAPDERRSLRDYAMARMPQFVDLPLVAAQPVVQR